MRGSPAISVNYYPLIPADGVHLTSEPITEQLMEIVYGCSLALDWLKDLTPHIEVIKVVPWKTTRASEDLTYDVKVSLSGLSSNDKIQIEETISFDTKRQKYLREVIAKRITERIRGAVTEHCRVIQTRADWWKNMLPPVAQEP